MFTPSASRAAISNWAMTDKQEMIDIIETVYRGASKGRGLVVAPKGSFDQSIRGLSMLVKTQDLVSLNRVGRLFHKIQFVPFVLLLHSLHVY